MPRIFVTGHDNFGNRGCEALLRSTVELLREGGEPIEFVVPSSNPAADARQWPEAASRGVTFCPVPEITARYRWWGRGCRLVPALQRLRWPSLNPGDPIASAIKSCDVILSIGGDCYSLDYGLVSLFHFIGLNEFGMRNAMPAVLWGASVGPFDESPLILPQVREHLMRLSLITVREELTRQYLESIGIVKNVVMSVDSAFFLQPSAVRSGPIILPRGRNGTVGLNLSPLVQRLHAQARPDSDLRSIAVEFVRWCISERDYAAVLVPHVTSLDGSGQNDDYTYLQEIATAVSDLGDQVLLVPRSLNAAELKKLISDCSLFIGARTHATIAALSTCVPTLSIAYSVKASGINRDIFGDERFVLPITQLTLDKLKTAFLDLEECASEVRSLVPGRLGEIRKRAQAGIEVLFRSTFTRAIRA